MIVSKTKNAYEAPQMEVVKIRLSTIVATSTISGGATHEDYEAEDMFD